MSSFLVNLVRRGAGLPATTIQAPRPSPFGPEIRRHGDGLTEDLATRNPANPTHHTPSIQRLSGTAPSLSIQPTVEEPAARPSLGPPQPVIPPMHEAEVTAMEPPQDSGPPVPPFHADREVITEIEVERGRHTLSPVTRTIEPTSRVAPGLPIREPGENQAVPQAALPTPTIRPASAESRTFLQFPKVTPAFSPTPPAPLPIHVRIGRVEVRAATAPTPTPARPSPSAPLGFDAYYRVRNYRS